MHKLQKINYNLELEQTQRRTHAARRAKRAGPDAISVPDAGCRAAQGSSSCAPPAEPDGRGGSVRTFLGKEEKYWPTTRCAPGFGPACTPRLRNLSGSNRWRYPIPEISFEISQDHLKAFAEIYNMINIQNRYTSYYTFFPLLRCSASLSPSMQTVILLLRREKGGDGFGTSVFSSLRDIF